MFKDKKLLYSIDEYLLGQILTDQTGEFLVQIKFQVDKGRFRVTYVDDEGNALIDNNRFKGNVIISIREAFYKKKLIFKNY